jgi:protein ImuA
MGLPSFSSPFASARHNVWRGDEMGMADAQIIGTGHVSLDAQLPGGGWPVGAMTEVLQSTPEAHVWQLLLPALACAVDTRGGPVVLIGAPHEPFGPALAAGGLPVEALMWIRSEASAARLWACEQALRCAEVSAVLAWLPQARVGDLRRLQLAAAKHEALLFVFRPEAMAQLASPARLRLQVVSAGAGLMDVHLLKRRGPSLPMPLTLPTRGDRMTSLLAASQLRRKRRQLQRADASEKQVTAVQGATVIRLDLHKRGDKTNAMDRVAVAA